MTAIALLTIFSLLTAPPPGFQCPRNEPTVPYEPLKKKIDAFADKLEKKKGVLLKGTSPFDYPWIGLEEYLQEQDINEIYLIGYGSLMNPTSAARTVKEPAEPVLVFGVDRLFNYNRVLSSLTKGQPDNPSMRANLNVRMSKDLHHAINAVVIKIPIDEIENLRDREVGYDLIPVIALPWKDFKGSPFNAHFFLAYILTVPEETVLDGQELTNPEILPYLPYYNMTREGAASYGDDFLQVYLNTTYLGDGKTTIYEWEKTGCLPNNLPTKYHPSSN